MRISQQLQLFQSLLDFLLLKQDVHFSPPKSLIQLLLHPTMMTLSYILSFQFCLLYPIGSSVFLKKCLIVPLSYAHKKSVELLVFIGTFEVFDYLYTPITTYKSTPNA